MSDSPAVHEPQTVKRIGLIGGPLVALVLALSGFPGSPLLLDPAHPQLNPMAAVLALMCIWWTTEAVPVGATALVPLALCPLLDLATLKDLAPAYGDANIFLYLGGFLVALAVEECGLHRRMALGVMALVGGKPNAIVAGVMLVTSCLSMWMSNTATALLMLPIGMSVLLRFDEQTKINGPTPRSRNLGICIMLGIAYASSIGGFATLVGTPPNTFIRAFFEDQLSDFPPLTFFGWMRMAVPLSFAMLFAAWALMVWVMFPPEQTSSENEFADIQEQRRALGRMTADEWRVLTIFVTLALAWTFREPFDGWGWAPALGLTQMNEQGEVTKRLIDDTGVAVFAGLACFLIPSARRPNSALIPFNSIGKVPWEILLLFGGGLALAVAMKLTKLDAFLGGHLAAVIDGMPPVMMMAATALGVTFFSEVASNLACIQMVAPLLKETALQLHLDPRLLLVPATIAASAAFMMPVGTPPNAIAYGTGRIRIGEMMWCGFWLNLIGAALAVLFVYLIPV